MLFGQREPRICCFLIKAQSDQKEKNISRDIYHSRLHLAISAPCSSPWPSSAWPKEGCRTLAQGHLPVVPRPLGISGLILQRLQQKTQRRHFCTSQVSWGRGWSALWAENFWEFTSQKYWKLLSKMKAGVTVRLHLATPSPFSKGSSRGWHLGNLGTRVLGSADPKRRWAAAQQHRSRAVPQETQTVCPELFSSQLCLFPVQIYKQENLALEKKDEITT